MMRIHQEQFPQEPSEKPPITARGLVNQIAYDFTTGHKINNERLSQTEQEIAQFAPQIQIALNEYIEIRNRALYNSIFTADTNSQAVAIALDKIRNSAHNEASQLLTETLPERFPTKLDAYHYIQDLVGDGVDSDTAKERREYDRYN